MKSNLPIQYNFEKEILLRFIIWTLEEKPSKEELLFLMEQIEKPDNSISIVIKLFRLEVLIDRLNQKVTSTLIRLKSSDPQ